MTRRRSQPPSRPGRSQGSAGPPSLAALDEISKEAVSEWLRVAVNLRSLHSALHFGLEEQRGRVSQELAGALQESATGPLAIQGWSRVVDYRYSLAPLSARGSLSGDGGRFNIGPGLNPSSFTPFPALYIGEDYETAFAEKFGQAPSHAKGSLTANELALRTPSSFTQVSLRGHVELVLDIERDAALAPFLEIVRKFHVPFEAIQKARKLGIRRPDIVHSIDLLRSQLTDPDWRRAPMQFDLPSNSQVFGRIVAAAGIHAIVYPSTRQPRRRCVALFPQNWEKSESFIEVADGAPEGARLTRVDGSSPYLD